MGKAKKIYVAMILILFIQFICYGCQKKVHKNEVNNVLTSDEVYYHVRDIVLPDPDLSIQEAYTAIGDNCERVNEMKIILQNDVVYRLVVALGELERRYYLQICQSPYTDWEVYNLDFLYDYYDETASTYLDLIDFDVTNRNEIYFILQKVTLDSSNYATAQDTCYLTLWDREHGIQSISELPEALDMNQGYLTKDVRIFDPDNIYVFMMHGQSIKKLNHDIAIENSYLLEYGIWELIQNQSTGEVYYYGVSDDLLELRSLETNESFLENYDQVGLYDNDFIKLTCSDSGQIYMYRNRKLLRLNDAKGFDTVSDLLNQGYLINHIYGMSTQDETVYLLAEVESEYCLLSANEQDRPTDKQEIIVADVNGGSEILNAISMFNRRSDLYHITVLSNKENETYQEHLNRLQFEVSSGNYPDIYLIPDYIAESYARNGYFMDMSSYTDGLSNLWINAFEASKIDDIQYGIPYSACLSAGVCSKDLVGERTSWTIEEMMDIIQNSNTKYLLYTHSFAAINVIYYSILNDYNNDDYIDWNKGISHLTDKPFLELLKFAKDYSPQDINFSNDEIYEFLAKGTIAIDHSHAITPTGMLDFNRIFKKNYTIIGYPNQNGTTGVNVSTSCIYVSSMTDKMDGIEAFIDFFLSDTVQLDISTTDFIYGHYDFAYFPVRLDVMEEMFQYYLVPKYTDLATHEKYACITEEEAELLRELIAIAQPEMNNDAIYDIIDEELGAYLSGQKTAEEVAAIMDNRVQLYFDEQK